ncbi:serine/threonine protein kinase [bacterium]|nr:serine/threonine protein kinase [bacterium]
MTGQSIGGFEIVREIGRGGMGVVYEARQTSPRRNVALKVLPPELAHVPQVAARFADEANRVAVLEGHPSIVTVYAAGEDKGIPYFAMQLLPGADLEQHLRREGRLCLDQAAEIVAQVAEALDFAHQRGVVHRDVKPANIMFDSQGRPLVTDFGIAKAREEYRLTQTGMTIGTPEYASPEQIKGNPLDGRSDLYSLGVVLYQAVCGQMPFTATTPMAYAVKHVSEPPLPPSSAVGDIPPALEQVIMRCLAKEPHERFSSGRELAAVLRGLRLPHVKCGAAPLPGTTYVTPRPLPPQSVGPSPSRMSGAVIALVVIGALALLAGIAMIAITQNAPPPSDTQPDTGAVAMQSTPPPPPPPPVYTPVPDSPPAPPVEVEVPGNAEQSPPPPPPPPPGDGDGAALERYYGDGFSILKPSGWTDSTSRTGGQGVTELQGSSDQVRVKVDWQSWRDSDIGAYPRSQDAKWRQGSKFYECISMEPSTLGGNEALRWEFLRDVDGVRMHTIDVFANCGSRGYAVWCRAPADEWDQWGGTFEQIINSFRPD